jgi:hypothetical protein
MKKIQAETETRALDKAFDDVAHAFCTTCYPDDREIPVDAKARCGYTDDLGGPWADEDDDDPLCALCELVEDDACPVCGES